MGSTRGAAPCFWATLCTGLSLFHQHGAKRQAFSRRARGSKTAKIEEKMTASDEFNPFSWPSRAQHVNGLKHQRLRLFQGVI